MKLTIEKSDLHRGLSRLQAVVEKRSSMPILANVLLTATSRKEEGQLELVATDLEVGIRDVHTVQVDEPGSITVSARKLFDIVRELPDESIQLSAEPDAFLEIHCGRIHFSLAGDAAEEYPTLPSFSPDHLVSLQASILSTMIERTIYAASVDETRYNLNGVYFEVLPETEKIRMVATDGHRLALVDRAIGSEATSLTSGVIIPRKGLAELKRLVDEEDADQVEIGFEGNSGLARKNSVTLVMRLIEGKFPNYQQVIPANAELQLTLPNGPLIRAVRRVALLSAERSHAVKLELTAGVLRLSSSNPDLGHAQEELDADYSGEDLTIGFNAKYLQESLAAFGAKEIQLSLHDANSPVIVRPMDDTDSLAVVMPMRL
jgi:DNA polymerase-3 subunit beta